MTKSMTVEEAVAQIRVHLEGARVRSLDDNRERLATIKRTATKLTTAQLADTLSLAQALLGLPLGRLDRATRGDVADVYSVFGREWSETRF